MAWITEEGIHNVYAFVICLSVLAVYDGIICTLGYTGGRWFNVHAFANAIVVLFCLPSMYRWVTQPLSIVSPIGQETPDPLGADWLKPEVLFHPSNSWCVLMIIAVHTYHCLAFKLSQQDIFHHFLFVPTIGVGGGLLTSWGPIRGVCAFFISGLPGGIDYANLVRLKYGHTTKLDQKMVSAKLNVWVRGPGCGVLVPATIFAAWAEGRVESDLATSLKLLFVAAFSCYNGLHYMEESVKNYQMHLTRTLLDAKHSAEVAKLKETWQPIESETKQRESGFDFPAIISERMRSVTTPDGPRNRKKE